MSRGKPEHPPVVYVEWTDASQLSDGTWGDAEEAAKDADKYMAPISAAGFLLVDHADHIVLALAYNDHAQHVMNAMMIPRSAITLVKQLRPARGMAIED